jgi:transcriptional accessory protein Tex/SPT6
VVKVGDIVTVWVISVDVQKKRIALRMKKKA